MTAQPVAAGSLDLGELLPVRGSAARLRPWLVFAAVVIFAFFGLIFSRVSLDRSGFEIDDLESRIAIEEARHGGLVVEVARLQDPGRIVGIAISNGLVYPEERIAIAVPLADETILDPDYLWAQLRTVLAQP